MTNNNYDHYDFIPVLQRLVKETIIERKEDKKYVQDLIDTLEKQQERCYMIEVEEAINELNEIVTN